VADDQARQVFEQVLDVAAQNGVTGTVVAGRGRARDAECGTGGGAVAAAAPGGVRRDRPWRLRRGHHRLREGHRAGPARRPRHGRARPGLPAAPARRVPRCRHPHCRRRCPQDLDAQLAVADLDVSGGHLEDAFDAAAQPVPDLDRRARMLCAPGCSTTSRSRVQKTRASSRRGVASPPCSTDGGCTLTEWTRGFSQRAASGGSVSSLTRHAVRR
jgi:hypothetical protein